MGKGGCFLDFVGDTSHSVFLVKCTTAVYGSLSGLVTKSSTPFTRDVYKDVVIAVSHHAWPSEIMIGITKQKAKIVRESCYSF